MASSGVLLFTSVTLGMIALSIQCDSQSLNRCNNYLAGYRDPGGHAATAEYCRKVTQAKECFENELSDCDNRAMRNSLSEGLHNAQEVEKFCATGRCSEANIHLCYNLAQQPDGQDEARVCNAIADSMYCLRLAERQCTTDEQRRSVLNNIEGLQGAEKECSDRGYSVYRATTPDSASSLTSNLFHFMAAIVLLFILSQ